MIPFARHCSVAAESDYVTACLLSGSTSGDGPFTRRASALLGQLLGVERVLLTTSCTHALEMMPLVLGLQPGDEVIMPSFTFSSTANAFALRGVTIRFAEVDGDRWSMGPDDVTPLLNARTRAVVAVGYNGVSHRLAELEELCARHGVALLVDAAQSLGATHAGRSVASYGALSALSFHATKNLSCGEGGALVVNDASLLHRAEMVREKGTDRSQFLRGEVDKYTWRCVGSSYLMSDLNAAVLLAQLESFEAIQAHRHAVWSVYRSVLEPVSARLGFSLQKLDETDGHPAHLFGLLLPPEVERAALLAAMAEAGVRATSHYEPLHSAPAHGGSETLPVTDGVAARMLRLPIHGAVSAQEAARIAALLVSMLERHGSGGEP